MVHHLEDNPGTLPQIVLPVGDDAGDRSQDKSFHRYKAYKRQPCGAYGGVVALYSRTPQIARPNLLYLKCPF